ncbi:uncharacterized protein FIBRA_02215 [Fibroporia radiculosa]|uniref:Uncharacterized protein n=1 Tax=Fibroporia radiculosa TaxID=599839 RepID=J4HUJ7_9APHY|nr:uncharacterized protein FIBRA_02215 [Fibroporia radiculosa]CCM00187.1 predicted protein [Fibroporia radiculosa]
MFHIMLSLMLLSLDGSSTFATVTLEARQTVSPCAGLGNNTWSITPYNFTLAAYNITLPNANVSGVPLIYAPVQGFTPTVAIATSDSFLAESGLQLNYLYNNTLNPRESNGSSIAVSGNPVAQGMSLQFLLESHGNTSSSAQIYCVKDAEPNDGYPYPILAVNGDADNFSLCLGLFPLATDVSYVIYRPIQNTSGYIYDSCYSVRLNVLWE